MKTYEEFINEISGWAGNRGSGMGHINLIKKMKPDDDPENFKKQYPKVEIIATINHGFIEQVKNNEMRINFVDDDILFNIYLKKEDLEVINKFFK
jgi:hypothetical protein